MVSPCKILLSFTLSILKIFFPLTTSVELSIGLIESRLIALGKIADVSSLILCYISRIISLFSGAAVTTTKIFESSVNFMQTK